MLTNMINKFREQLESRITVLLESVESIDISSLKLSLEGGRTIVKIENRQFIDLVDDDGYLYSLHAVSDIDDLGSLAQIIDDLFSQHSLNDKEKAHVRYRSTSDSVGDNDDAWEVYRIDEDDDSEDVVALVATETMAIALTALL